VNFQSHLISQSLTTTQARVASFPNTFIWRSEGSQSLLVSTHVWSYDVKLACPTLLVLVGFLKLYAAESTSTYHRHWEAINHPLLQPVMWSRLLCYKKCGETSEKSLRLRLKRRKAVGRKAGKRLQTGNSYVYCLKHGFFTVIFEKFYSRLTTASPDATTRNAKAQQVRQAPERSRLGYCWTGLPGCRDQKTTHQLLKNRKDERGQIQDKYTKTHLNNHTGCTALLKDNIYSAHTEQRSLNY